MKAYLLKPDLVPPPPELNCYNLERRFYEEFGVPSPPLDEWPVRKVADYVLIQQAIDEVEAERNKSSTPGVGGGQPSRPAGNPDATEAAYQAMRVNAQPPPMPPPS